jgi:hypothetical protein
MRSIVCFWKSINVHLFFLKAPFEGQKLTRLVDEVWKLLGNFNYHLKIPPKN